MDAESVDVQLIDAFSDRAFAGNPAGVVLDAAELDEAQMQQMAREINASETVFLVGRGDDDWRARYFTPTQEVDFCGHATLALGAALAWAGRVEPAEPPARIALVVPAGDIALDLRPHPATGVEVTMTQAPPRFADFGYRIELLAGALGMESYQIPPSWPLGLAYTGLWALVVPVVSREAIDAARPDFAALADLNNKLGAASTHLYTHAGPNKLYCRDFSPAVGVAEDPFTGSAMGATAALLVREDAVDTSPPTTRLEAEQGQALGRPGQARLEVDHGDAGPISVRLTGTAALSLEGRLLVPPAR